MGWRIEASVKLQEGRPVEVVSWLASCSVQRRFVGSTWQQLSQQIEEKKAWS